MIKKLLTAGLLTLGLLSASAQAIPLVYSCTINDYLNSGVETTSYQYIPHDQIEVFESDSSEARIYLDEDKVLHMSIRPKNQTTFDYNYSSVTGYNLPLRLDALLALSKTNYAALFSCQL